MDRRLTDIATNGSFSLVEGIVYGALLFGVAWVLTTPGVMDAIIHSIDNVAMVYVESRGLLKVAYVENHVPIKDEEKETSHGNKSNTAEAAFTFGE